MISSIETQSARGRLWNTGLAVVALGSLVLAGSDSGRPTAENFLGSGSQPAVAALEQECLQPTAAELAETTSLLDQVAINSQHTRDEIKNAGGNGALDPITERDNLRKAAANELGLTIYDYSQEFADLNDALDEGSATIPFETYFSRTKEFMSRYGVDLELGKADQEYDNKGTVPDPANLASDKAKYTLMSLVSSIGELPVEFIRYTGLKHIIIIDIHKEATAGFAETDGAHDTFYVDLLKAPVYIFNHELSHLVDTEQCGPGGMFWDPAFTDLNQDDIYHVPGDNKSLDDYSAFFLQCSYALQQAESTGDQATEIIVKALLAKYAGQVVTASDYGFKNVSEDKAEIDRDLLSMYAVSALVNTQMPRLRAKTDLLAARIYHDFPQFIKYLSLVAQ